MEIKLNQAQLVLLLALYGVIAYASLRGSIRSPALYGDGVEYVIQTQSLAFDLKVAIDTKVRSDYWNQTSPYELKLSAVKHQDYALSQGAQVGGGFGGLYPDLSGELRYYHFWTYSLIVAPAYWLLHQLSDYEYLAFHYVNLVAFFLPFLVAWYIRSGWIPLLVLMFLSCSPFFAYLEWQHPEILLFSLISTAFLLIYSNKFKSLGPILLGIAASQNFPILFLFPAYLVSDLYHNQRLRLSSLVSYGLAFMLGITSLLYYQFYFDTPSLIEAIGQADVRFASINRAVSLFTGPMIGAVWLVPTIFLFLFSAISYHNLIPVLVSLSCIFCAAWLTTGTVNLNSAQMGVSRYAIWFLAPLVAHVLVSKCDWRRCLCATVINLVSIWYFSSWEFVFRNYARFSYNSRAINEVAELYIRTGLKDDIEVIVENIRGSELPAPSDFNGIYVWNPGKRKVLIFISERAVGAVDYFLFKSSSDLSGYKPLIFSKNDFYGIRFKRLILDHYHPILGKYALIELPGNIGTVRTDVPIYVR